MIKRKKNKIDLNFKLAASALSESNIFFWVGQGSLLGIVRDNKLIDWDHDIDFCLWNRKNKKKVIIKILQDKGFIWRSDLTFGNKYAQLSFDKSGGRRVDINFYQKGVSSDGERIAFISWGYPRNVFMSMIDAISYADIYNSKYKFLINKLKVFKPIAHFLKKIFINMNYFYKVAGYKQPLKFLKKFKKVYFYKTKVNIPYYKEEYLEYVYGKNWKKPKKNFTWWKLKNLNYE